MSEPARPDVSWSLIARAADGDRTARSVFGQSYLPVVRSFLKARWAATPLIGEVDDATQEVFVECLREGGVLSRADPARGDLRGLMFGVTRKVASRIEERHQKRAAREPAAGSVLDTVQGREQSLSMLFDREWARTLLRLAGARMRAEGEQKGPGAKLRVELLRLRFQEGLPIRDIAAQWEIDPDAVHRAYAKAREEFKKCLRAVVAEHVVRAEAELEQEVARVFQLLA